MRLLPRHAYAFVSCDRNTVVALLITLSEQGAGIKGESTLRIATARARAGA